MLFSPPDLLRLFLSGPLVLDEAKALQSFEQSFVSFACLIELGDGAIVDTAVRHFWVETETCLALDRPTVVYGGSASVRASFSLVLTAIEGAQSAPRRFPVMMADSEREAVLELTILRTRHARDSIVPR